MGKYYSYITSWKKRFTNDQVVLKRRITEIHQAAKNCANLLAQKYGVERVYLFGSLTEEIKVHAQSDIDLAVEGLASHFYFKALSELWDVLPPELELDLVPLEDAHEKLKEKIINRGKLLYERKSI